MTRHITAAAAMLMIAMLLLFDQANSDLNPYKAPPLFALGSGVQATGGFCGNLPQ